MWYRTFTGWLALVSTALRVFGVTGRAAILQLTEHNATVVREITEEITTNSSPEVLPVLNAFAGRVHNKVTLSAVIRVWLDYTFFAMEGGGIGIVMVIVFCRGQKHNDRQNVKMPNEEV